MTLPPRPSLPDRISREDILRLIHHPRTWHKLVKIWQRRYSPEEMQRWLKDQVGTL